MLFFLIFRALKEAERYISLQTTKDQVDKAYEDIIVFDNLVTLVERVNELVCLVTILLLIGGWREILPGAKDIGHLEKESQECSSMSSCS